MSAEALVLDKVTRSFGTLKVLSGLSLQIQRGEFVAIVGPSGCGKTTLLSILSGHDKPNDGRIDRAGQVRMVYQQDGLFPWMTVKENIGLGLRGLKQESEKDKMVADLLNLIRLDGFAGHYPHQLSGGMRQRVELARSLAGDVDILLLDEPFSALDYITRLRMRQELARILAERPRTVVLVTHDIEEAAQLADRVIVLTERPASIRCELKINSPRPRDLTNPEVVKTIHRVLTEMGIEKDESLN